MMYGGDINSKELRIFHNKIGVNFSISLTKLLTITNLFKVETIVTNKLYRVYPLFHCNTVTSSNPRDKILDTHCLILEKNEHETYLTFKTDSDAENSIFIDDENISYYGLTDSLTTAQLNGIISLIRENTILSDSLELNNHNILSDDIQASLSLKSKYALNNIDNIKLTGKAINTITKEPIKNKTFHLYSKKDDEWSFINSITTNNNGEYSYTDNSITPNITSSNIGTRDELQQLIDNAINNNESEIILTKDYRFTTRNPITITGSIKINGNGHIIDADNKSRIFEITGDNVTVTNLILLQANSGSTDGNGGAIKWTGDNGLLINTRIAYSIANSKGGAIYWNGAKGVIQNCKFISNATNGDGGALYVDDVDYFKAIEIISYGNYSNGDGGCAYLTGDNMYFKKWNISKDTTNGGTVSTFRVIGDNVTITQFNISQAQYHQDYTDYSTQINNNSVEYKIIPSTWINSRDDFSITNTYYILDRYSETSKGTTRGLNRQTTEHATYKFYNTHILKNNKGFIITDDMKNNPITVQLDDPLFEAANYNLTCTVKSITGANILDDSTNYITEDTFTVQLTEDSTVELDVSDYTNDSILLFDMNVDIDFKVPEIKFPGTEVTLEADNTTITVGNSVTLTATVIDEGTPVSGGSVSFYDGDTLLGSDNTDSTGEASISTSSLTAGTHNLKAVYDNTGSNTVTVTVNKITSTISLSATSSTITVGSNAELSGTLSVGADKTVTIKQNGVSIGTVTTTTGGAFTKSVSNLAPGSYSFTAEYAGDDTHTSVTSSEATVTVNKITPTLSLSASPTTITSGGTVTFSGVSSLGSGVTVYLLKDGVQYTTVTTGTDGAFSKAVTDLTTTGTYSFTARTEADSTHEAKTSDPVSVTVTAIPYDGVVCSANKNILSYADGDKATLYAQLQLDGVDVAIPNMIVSFKQGSTVLGTALTDNTGKATLTNGYTSAGVGDITITAESGSVVSEIYSIEDCIRYIQNPSACTSCNIPLPSTAELSYKMSKPTISGQNGGISLQLTDSSHTYFVGNWASNGTNGLLIRNTGSSTNLVNQTCSDITANTEYLVGITYDNGDWTYFKDNEVKSFSANYTPTEISIIQIQQGTMKDLKIKPL